MARPASNAVTVVAADQVPAGVGIDTGLALTFIRIWKTKGNIQGGREKPTPPAVPTELRGTCSGQQGLAWLERTKVNHTSASQALSVSLQLEHTGYANYFTTTQPLIRSNLPPHTHLSWALWRRNAAARSLGWVCCVKNAAGSFSVRSSTFWNPAVNSWVWRSWHGWRDTATFSQGKGRNTCGGGTGRHNMHPPHFRAVLVWGMSLVNYFLQVPARRSKVMEATLLLDIVLDPSPANRHWMSSVCQNTSTGFRNMTMTNAGPWSLLHLSFPSLEQHWMKRKQFLPSWHVLPVHWGGQIHLNPSTRSWQVPPWPQGFGEQSSISVMQSKERLSSAPRLAMAVTDKFDNGLLLTQGFPWGTERQQDFYLEFLGHLWFQQKPPLKIRVVWKRGSKHRGKFYPCSLFASGSHILIQQVSLKSVLNDIPECYKNSAFCFFQEDFGYSLPW